MTTDNRVTTERCGYILLIGQRGRSLVKPIICAVQGRCDAWATKLALAQDAVIAADDAVLELLGVEFPAGDAQQAGIVQEVVPAEQHLSRAIEIAIVLGARWGERVDAEEATAKPRAGGNSAGLQQIQSMWG